MSPRTPDIEDDNRTIADMSGVRRPRLFGADRDERPQSPSPFEGSSRSINDELQDDEERRMVILGTLKAALSIGMVYIVGFGIAIAVMLAIWT